MYPPYCSGWLVLYRPSVSQRLVAHLDRVRFFWIDDVFVTGLMAEELQIGHHSLDRFFTSAECGYLLNKLRQVGGPIPEI